MQTLNKNQKLVRLAMMAAITLILGLTPLGYIPVNLFFPALAFSITILVTPVAVGGLAIGWPAGTVLGLIFGLTSFFKAFTDPLGIILLGQSGFLTFLACVLPRVAVGVLADFFHKLIKNRDNLRKPWFYAFTGAVCSLANTVLFLGFLWLAFDVSVTGMTFLVVIGTAVSVNGLLEAAVNAVLVALITRALLRPRAKTPHQG